MIIDYYYYYKNSLWFLFIYPASPPGPVVDNCSKNRKWIDIYFSSKRDYDYCVDYEIFWRQVEVSAMAFSFSKNKKQKHIIEKKIFIVIDTGIGGTAFDVVAVFVFVVGVVVVDDDGWAFVGGVIFGWVGINTYYNHSKSSLKCKNRQSNGTCSRVFEAATGRRAGIFGPTAAALADLSLQIDICCRYFNKKERKR